MYYVYSGGDVNSWSFSSSYGRSSPGGGDDYYSACYVSDPGNVFDLAGYVQWNSCGINKNRYTKF